jgi:hypothetical protein
MEAASSGQKANRGCHAAADRARKRSWSGPRSSSHKTMTTHGSTSQSQLSTDLEMLHARVKGKSLTLAELKQSLKGAWLRHAARPVSVARSPSGLHAVSSHGKRNAWRSLHHAAQEKINRSTLLIDRAIEVNPSALYLNVGTIHAPGVTHGPCILVPAFFKVRHVPLHPAQDGRMS